MPEYITKEVLKERFARRLIWLKGDIHDKYSEGLYDGCEYDAHLIDEIPAANVTSVVRGKWVHITSYNDGERMIATCSHCRDRGEVRSIMTEFGSWEIDSPCCPNCGAKMDGVE